MGYSIILVDISNKLNLDEYLDFASKTLFDFETLYCSSQNVEKISQNFTSYVLTGRETCENAIDKLAKKCTKENIIIVRDALQYKKIEKLIKKHTNYDQIVCYKQTHKGYRKFWAKVQRFVGKVFMQNIKHIDYSIVLYGKLTSKVIKRVSSPSVLTRINSFTGVKYIMLDGGGRYKLEYNKKKAALKTVIPFSIGLVMVILKLAINFKMFITLDLIYYFIAIFAMVIGVVFGAKWILIDEIGDTEKKSDNSQGSQ